VDATLDTSGYLKQILSEAARSNPRYSLRAFARKLGLSPGGLSLILARKKKLSLARAYEVSEALGLEGKEKEYFLLLAQLESTASVALKAELHERIRRLFPRKSPAQNLAIEQFRMISEWHGLAILELVTSIGAAWGAPRIAQYLGVPRAEVDAMLERLVRLELIERLDDGSFARVADRLLVSSSLPSEAIRKYYEGVLDRARESVRTQSPQEKVAGTEVFAFDPSQLEAVRALTDQYLEDLRQLARQGAAPTEMYQAFVDVFRLNPKPVARAGAPKSPKKRRSPS
jgi:uncharacterized protein (TIGR02147 family)